MSAMILSKIEARGHAARTNYLSLFVSSSCSSKKLQLDLYLLTLSLNLIKIRQKCAKLSQVGKQPNHRLILKRFDSVFCGDLACEFN